MLIIGSNKVIPDDQVIFYDGFLYIISHTIPQDRSFEVKDITNNYTIDVRLINPEYDNPLSLEDIVREYPNVRKVIYEEFMCGYVYNYKNHITKNVIDGGVEYWEQVGTTCGYA